LSVLPIWRRCLIPKQTSWAAGVDAVVWKGVVRGSELWCMMNAQIDTEQCMRVTQRATGCGGGREAEVMVDASSFDTATEIPRHTYRSPGKLAGCILVLHLTRGLIFAAKGLSFQGSRQRSSCPCGHYLPARRLVRPRPAGATRNRSIMPKGHGELTVS